MKKIIKYISVLVIVIGCVTSCDVTKPIDDYELRYQLNAEDAIVDEASANRALAGAYSSLKTSPAEMFGVPSALSGIAGSAQAYYGDETRSWVINQPLDKNESGDNLTFSGMAGLYRAINDANWIIEKVGELSDEDFMLPERKNEMLGEAHGIRALMHFYLLRYWGQWYDDTSEYGIALRLNPTRDGEAVPRNTVAETYAQIHSDLDFAIANAPEIFMNSGYMNKIAARAIKAKAYLYQGNYPMAASTAKALIDESTGGGFGLSPTYTELFDTTSDAMFNNPEILFGLRGTLEAPLAELVWSFAFTIDGIATANLSSGSMTIGSQVINYDGSRVSSTTGPGFYGLTTLKGPGIRNPGDNALLYYARMAEVYLIFAEADARVNTSVTPEALDALNAIRIRAGATTTGDDGFETYPTSITYDEFLEAVRIEKMVELLAESEEEWFDMVRYDWEDGFGSGFQVSDFKPTATDSDKFILPYSRFTLEAGGGVEKQNPSYE